MKRIVLPSKWKRIVARVIDLAILITCSCIVYFTGVLPFVFDNKAIDDNTIKINEIYEQTELFIIDRDGVARPKSAFDEVDKLQDLYNVDIKFKEVEYKDVHISESLYKFHSTEYNDKEVLVKPGLNRENFEKDVLKIGSEQSNIKAFNYDNYTFTLIDPKLEQVTFTYVVGCMNNACNFVIEESAAADLNADSQRILMNAVLFFIPVLVGFSLIFDLIIPLCAPNGQSIGKFIMHLIILDKDGYYSKRWRLIPRWLCWVIVELLGSIITMFGMMLISYTFFLFNKKNRCLHDFLGKSVVADKDETIYFMDQREENLYKQRYEKLNKDKI